MTARVGVFLNSRRVGSVSWYDFCAGRTALSGTDGTVFEVAGALTSHVDVILIATAPVPGFPGEVAIVDGLEQACAAASLHRCDVFVFTNTQEDRTLAALRECDRLALPAIVWDHNGPTQAFATAFHRSPWVKRVVTVSRSQVDWIRDHPVFAKSTVIPNFVPEAFDTLCTPRDFYDPFAIAFVGGLTPQKGFQYLAAAWPAIRAQFPAATLDVFGSGSLHSRGQATGPLGIADPDFEHRLSAHLGTSRPQIEAAGVRLRGLTSRAELASELPRFAVGVVNPTLKGSVETFCVSALEFQAAGVPVVGGCAGGLRETVQHARTGILVRSYDEIAPAVARLLGCARANVAMRGAARLHALGAYPKALAISRWTELLHEVTSGLPPSPLSFAPRVATWKSYLREGVRLARRLPGCSNLPTAAHLLDALRRRHE